MLKSIYRIYLTYEKDGEYFDVLFAEQRDEYPSEEDLEIILDAAPEGYHVVFVERSYVRAK